MNKHSVAPFIFENYREYWGISEYPADECAVFCSADEEWGILSNMAASKIQVGGLCFRSSEHLFQMMKFIRPDVVVKVWEGRTAHDKHSNSIKMTAKSYEPDHRREDWGSMIVDAMKFCLMQKYEQCETFRKELERSKGKYIVEKQANPKKKADTWSAKLEGDKWVGPNLLGRLLMELRDNGKLEYKLPEDALDFVEFLKLHMEVFYHGTCRLFDTFDPNRLGSGEGKSKFGHGIYITSSYTSAALYASKVAKCHGSDCKYVYTLEVPDLTDDNHLFSCKPVNTKVAERLEKALGETIPEDAKSMGKFFRKYIGNLLIGNRKTIKQMTGSASYEAEDAVTKFLNDNGVIFLAWPQAQTKPDGDTNRAVLNAECIRVVKIEQVQTDDKNKLIKGSETIVKQF